MRRILCLLIASVMAVGCAQKKSADPSPRNSGPAGTDTAVTIAGDVYPVVQIGNQSWTAVNYRGPGGIFNTGTADASLLNGKLYTPLEATQIPIPAGWHIPTYHDYLQLLIARGATQNTDGSYSAGLPVAESLMATSGWEEGGGNNYSRFNAVASGFYHAYTFYGSGNGASFLHSLSTGTAPDQAFMIGPGPDGKPLIFLGISLIEGDACSVRFVRDN